MSHRTLRDFFLAAPMIYAAILRLAAQNATLPRIAALKDAQLGFKEALRGGDIAARALAHTRFHEVTGAMAGNIYLLPSFRRLLIDHARISMTFFRPSDSRAAQDLSTASQQQDAIITAIEAGDADAAAGLAIAHWNLSRHNIEQFVMPQGLDIPLGKGAPASRPYDTKFSSLSGFTRPSSHRWPRTSVSNTQHWPNRSNIW